MAKSTHSAFDMPKAPDFAQMYADYNRMFGDFSKLLINGKTPAFDFDAVMTCQRKNLEAMAAAQRAAVEGARAVAQRQAEILRRGAEEFVSASRAFTVVGSPEDKLAKQVKSVKDAFETAIASLREISDLVQKSNSEAIDLLTKRAVESFDEVQDALAAKTKKQAAA